MTPETSDKTMARLLASLLADYGVRDVVLSPGSRNAPLIISLGRSPRLRCLTVVDERSAAFIALGMALQSGRPTAVVCTSGSALLDYAPAVAEAMYRGVPLIVVSADRPEQWIDRDDSQTIRQPGALAAVVRRSVHIGADLEVLPSGRRRASLLIQEALTAALAGRPAPVHINMAFDTPLADTVAVDEPAPERILTVAPAPLLPTAEARAIGRELASPRKVLVVCGFASPDSIMNRAMARLAALPNVAVLAELTSNIHAESVHAAVGRLLAEAPGEDFVPDVVVTCGGSLVSARLKQWLRGLPEGVDHWSVGLSDAFLDTFGRLTRRIMMAAPLFFRQLASAMHPHRAPSDYAALWRRRDEAFAAAVPPGPGMEAFRAVMDELPRRWNVHFSNGMTIRHALFYDCARLHRCEANRGVSGIEGSTSTALGAALAFKGAPTLLLTGDMSFQYDLAALCAPCLTPRLKIAVFDNGGGAIFREVAATRRLPEVEERFAAATQLHPRAIADARGLALFEAASPEEIRRVFPAFAAEAERPALLYIKV